MRKLENSRLVESYLESDREVVGRAYGNPDIAVSQPVRLWRLTPDGARLDLM